MSGYFKLYRELFNKPIWLNSSNEQRVILITLLSMANWKETEWDYFGEKIVLKPGQFITSLPKIVEKCKVDGLEPNRQISVQNVRTMLQKCERCNFLTVSLTGKSTKSGRVITIVNWRLYQQEELQPNRQTNREPNRHIKEEVKEYKELKEDKEINNNTYSAFSEKIQIALSIFEKFIRRPVHPSEIERIVKALDKYSVEEFEEACKKTKFKYGGYKLANVERILQKSTEVAEDGEKEKGFELFWELYPSKRKKPVARIAWMNMRVHSEEQYALINSAVERYKKTNQWQEENGRYIPDPDTFLQDERWADEIKLPEAVQTADKEAQEKAEWIAKNKERWAAIPPEKRKYRLACFMGLDWEEVRDMPYVGT